MTEELRALLYPLGFLAQFAFGIRFLIQWLKSEKAGRSLVTASFWQISLLGNVLLLIHSIIQVHFPIAAVQSINTIMSWRNLDLLKPKEKQSSLRLTLVLLGFALLATGLIFVAQSLAANHHHIHWLESPRSLGLSQPRTVGPLMHAFGMVGVVIYSLRFWVQWWRAEKGNTDDLGNIFWRLSIIGAIISAIYFFSLLDWVNMVPPILALLPYCRNLLLSKEAKKELPFSQSIFVFCGEKSGDLLGQNIISSLQNELPHFHFFGVTSQKTGVENILPIEEFQSMGFSALIKELPRLLRNMRKLQDAILKKNPQICLFIDQPDFSYRLAKKLRKKGFKGKIVQVVAPTVWAWRKGRAKSFAKYFDLLLTLFDFEPPYFTKEGLKTVFTGHPLVEKLTFSKEKKKVCVHGYVSDPPLDAARADAKIAPEVNSQRLNTAGRSVADAPAPSEEQALNTREHIQKSPPIIAIFPGSRPEEVRRNLSIQLDGISLFCSRNREPFQVSICLSSPDFAPFVLEQIEKRKKEGCPYPITIHDFENRYELMQKSHLACAKAGTVTLELALMGVPTVVSYDVSRLNRFIAQHVFNINLPYFCLVNILRQKELFPELIRTKPTPENIAEKLELLSQDETTSQRLQEEMGKLKCQLLSKDGTPTYIAKKAILELVHER